MDTVTVAFPLRLDTLNGTDMGCLPLKALQPL